MPVYELENIQPQLDASVYIAPSGIVIGKVTIGRASSVWFHCVLRGDVDRITIGEESNIQDLSVLHVDPGKPLVIGNQVTVGHRCILHGCTIEDNCLIGMGATIMNGARIGHGSIVAAGSVVLENTEVPPFSLVTGLPAKVKRTFEADIVEKINRSSVSYVNRSEIYRREGNFSLLE
jgi:carbonic anhydrase/acetyltransferase-like protein (isoleucine patch superfamily)